MLKAYKLHPANPDEMAFVPPQGIEIVRIDAESMMLAGPSCTNTFEEAFIFGTAPARYCPLHGETSHPPTEDVVSNISQ
jgi:hypothetical protein